MWTIHFFSSLASTHEYAKENISTLRHGSVIMAGTQTSGRGRGDRTWISEEGGLYFSLVLKPSPNDRLHCLTQLLSLAVCNAFESFGGTAWIKWPNDVLVADKKLAGILSEAVVSPRGELRGVILGAGVNMAQKQLSVAGREVVSLKALGYDIDPHAFLSALLGCFQMHYHAFLEQGFAVIRDAYLTRFATLGREVLLDTGKDRIRGMVQTVSVDGNVVLLSENGGIREILTGEIL